MKNRKLYDPNAGAAGGGGTETKTGAQGQTQTILQKAPDNATAAAQPWRGILPEDIRGDKLFDKFTGKTAEEALPEIAKSLVHANTMVGAEKLIKPKEDYTEEQWNQFHSSIPGVPTKADGYKIQMPELAKDFPVRPETVTQAMEAFHKAGLTNRQAKIVAESYIGHRLVEAKAAKEAADAAYQKNVDTINKLWGDQKDQQGSLVKLALRTYGKDLPQELQPLIEEMIADNGFQESKFFPIISHVLARAGKDNLEDVAMRGGSVTSLGTTPAEAEVQKAKLEAEKGHILMNPSHPEYAVVNAEHNRLIGILTKVEHKKQLTP